MHTTLRSPSPSFLQAKFVAIRDSKFPLYGRSNQDFRVGRHHNHHATQYCYVPNFTVYSFPLPQSRTGLGYISVSSPCTRYFFLCPPHTSTFSRNYPLGGQTRLTNKQLPMKAGWWDVPLMLRDLAVSNLHHIPSQVWEVAHSSPMEVPWPSGTCSEYPNIQLPFACEPISNRSPHTPVPPLPHP